MDREEFSTQLRDVLANIHDIAALNRHSMSDLVVRLKPGSSRAESLRRFICEGIESLKPTGEEVKLNSLAWRYYLILSKRYVEGATVQEVQKLLSLGARQERRLHGRALSALISMLWDRLAQSPPDQGTQPVPSPYVPERVTVEPEEYNAFQVTLEPLRLDRIVQEVASLCLPRIRLRHSELVLHVPENLPMVQADRIILRQVLLDLFNGVLQSWIDGEVTISVRPGRGLVLLEIQASADLRSLERDRGLLSGGMIQYWVSRLHAKLSCEADGDDEVETGPVRRVHYVLELQRANRSTILAVDDHEQAIRIIERYLGQTNIQVVGVTDPAKVLGLARTMHPQAVLLDVMMPSVDGWEILQALKSDPETQKIPVIVCSVWNQPELAFSLGANGFLKKPLSQSELLGELARSNLLDTSGGSPPASS